MENGTQEVSQGVAIIWETGASLDKIGVSVKQTLQRIQGINQDVGNLSDSSETIVRTMDEVSQVAENNAAIAEQVAASAEEQSASVHQIASSVSNITQLAHNLEGLANQFKFEKLNNEDDDDNSNNGSKSVALVKKAKTARLVSG